MSNNGKDEKETRVLVIGDANTGDLVEKIESTLESKDIKTVSKSTVSTVSALALASGWLDYDMPWNRGGDNSTVRKESKCSLPDCENTTKHNGGYCCAEHCKEHRKMRSTKNA